MARKPKKVAIQFERSLKVPNGIIRLTDWHTGKPLYLDRSLIVLVKPLPAGHYEPECDCETCEAAGAREAGERTLVITHMAEVVVLEEPDECLRLLATEISDLESSEATAAA